MTVLILMALKPRERNWDSVFFQMRHYSKVGREDSRVSFCREEAFLLPLLLSPSVALTTWPKVWVPGFPAMQVPANAGTASWAAHGRGSVHAERPQRIQEGSSGCLRVPSDRERCIPSRNRTSNKPAR